MTTDMLYLSYVIIFLWADHVARMEGDGSVLKILTGTPTGKRPFGKLRRI